MIETVRKLFAYDEWAIVRILPSLKSLPSGNEQVLRRLTHLLVADKLWFLRLRGQDNHSESQLAKRKKHPLKENVERLA